MVFKNKFEIKKESKAAKSVIVGNGKESNKKTTKAAKSQTKKDGVIIGNTRINAGSKNSISSIHSNDVQKSNKSIFILAATVVLVVIVGSILAVVVIKKGSTDNLYNNVLALQNDGKCSEVIVKVDEYVENDVDTDSYTVDILKIGRECALDEGNDNAVISYSDKLLIHDSQNKLIWQSSIENSKTNIELNPTDIEYEEDQNHQETSDVL